MPDQLLPKYIVSPLILSISCGELGDNGCLGRSGYLGFERVGTAGRDRKGGWGEG
jgi:hypothetical protein